MITPRSFTSDFLQSLALADLDRALLAQHFAGPIERVVQADRVDDRNGTDFWVYRLGTRRVGVDMKVRRQGARKYWRSPDDPEVPIELWSKAEYGVAGALYRAGPVADFIAYRFDDCPERLYVLSGEALRRVAVLHREEWLTRFGERYTVTATDESGPYSTSFIPVPVSVVLAAIEALDRT